MEKRHHKQRTIGQIKINDKEFITSDKKILAECGTFYMKLYAPKESPPSQISTHILQETVVEEECFTPVFCGLN